MFIDDVMKKNPNMLKPEAVFKIQNVADYFFMVEKTGELDYEEDIISYNFPFLNTWFEYQLPKYVRIDNEIRQVNRRQIGVYAQHLDNIPGINITKSGLRCVDIAIYSVESGRAVWYMSRKFFIDKNGKYLGRRISKDPTGDVSPLVINPLMEPVAKMNGLGVDKFASKLFGNFGNPILMALNFIHCKNVEQITNNIDSKLIKVRQKRNKPYFEKYYTLAIDPIRKILNTEGEAESKGLAHALHICRGHFKDYTEKGLFGKIKGTFWWPATLRGNEEVGKITKDYEIKI